MQIEQSYMNRYLVDVAPDAIADKVLEHLDETARLLATVPEESSGHAYAEGKWTVRQLMAHILVSQRIFVTRAMCISRGETKSLPGFDEGVYADNWPSEKTTLKEIVRAYEDEARATRSWLRWMTPEEMQREGEANGIRLKPQHIFRALIGHERHHLRMLQEFYGVKLSENGISL